jgi:hypothetical protein
VDSGCGLWTLAARRRPALRTPATAAASFGHYGRATLDSQQHNRPPATPHVRPGTGPQCPVRPAPPRGDRQIRRLVLSVHGVILRAVCAAQVRGSAQQAPDTPSGDGWWTDTETDTGPSKQPTEPQDIIGPTCHPSDLAKVSRASALLAVSTGRMKLLRARSCRAELPIHSGRAAALAGAPPQEDQEPVPLARSGLLEERIYGKTWVFF